jgi:tryptophanase
MPFSALTDPVELARAGAALDAAWNEIRLTVPHSDHERERTHLAYIIASLVAVAEDEDDLTQRVIERYRQRAA